MSDTDPHLRLRTPADLIATLPYLLGYRIEDSLVVAAVDQDRLGLIQRLDLPGGSPGRPARRPPCGVLDVARRLLRREDPDAVLIVAYESSPGASAPLRRAITGLCDRYGWAVLVEAVTRDDRWWDVDAGDDLAGPGRPVPDAPQVPAVAECVAVGLAPLPGRASLAVLFEPVEASPEAVQRIVGRIAAQRRRRRRQPAGPHERLRHDALAWRTWLAADAESMAESEWCLARCVASLDDTDLRDALIAWLAPGILPPSLAPARAMDALVAALGPIPGGDAARDQVRDAACDDAVSPASLRERGRNRLIDAVRHVPAEEQVALLTVFAATAWWHGDGAIAGEAAERARRLRPSYTLAVLVHEMVRHGLRFGTATGLAG